MSNRFRALAVDLDGTLLDNQGKLSQRNLAAIKSLNKAGTLIILCSARPPLLVAPFSRSIGLRTPIIGHNGGSLTQHNGTTKIRCFYIAPLLAAEFLQEVQPLRLSVRVYINNDLYINKYQDSMVFTMERADAKEPVVTDLNSFARIGVSKISLSCTGQEIDNLDHILKKPKYNDLRSTRPRDGYFEILPTQAKKSAMLETVLNIYGIEPSETIAIGDYFNDIDLFDYVGYAVAVDNAPEEVKKHADTITLSNVENGVADFIDRKMLV